MVGARIEAQVLHRGRAAFEAPCIVDPEGDLHARHDRHSGYGKREESHRFQHSLSTCQSMRTIFSPRYPIKTRCSLISRAVVVPAGLSRRMPLDVFATVPTFSQPSSGHTSHRRQTREATEIRKNHTEAFPNSERGEEIKSTGGRCGNRSQRHRARLRLQEVHAEGFGETYSRFQAHRRRAQSRTLDRRRHQKRQRQIPPFFSISSAPTCHTPARKKLRPRSELSKRGPNLQSRLLLQPFHS